MINKRESNYELMRIILMFFVFFWHVIINVIFSYELPVYNKLIWNFCHFLLEIHIDTFILLTGYFQSKKEKIGISKVLKLNNQAYFYKIVFLLIFIIFSIKPLSKMEIFRIVQPLTLYEQYWYISIYLLLYMVSPFINKLLNNLDKKSYRFLIIILFFMSAILPVVSNQLVFNNNKGFSLLNFVLLYSIGAYLRKYPAKESYLFSKLTTDTRKILFLFMYVFFAILNLLIYYFQYTLLSSNNSLLIEIASIINNMKIAYNNPLLIIEAIFFFMYFGELKINSKIINFISVRTLDIYLIHDNQLLRSVIYGPIYKLLLGQTFGLRFLAVSVIVSIIIYTICFILGLIREIIFKFINILPFIKKLKKHLKYKIESLGFGITY